MATSNTILTHTEHGMPKALGEFGKAKNSGVINILMDILNKTKLPIDHTKLYSMVRLDVNSQNEFTEILRNLTIAGKIQYIRGSHVGYLPSLSSDVNKLKSTTSRCDSSTSTTILLGK